MPKTSDTEKIIDKHSKENDLTLKQRLWIKAYIETGNATEAAMRVYDCKNRNVANALGNENLAKLSMPDLMEDMGLTDVALINIGAEGLSAQKTDITGDKHPDYAVRHKYWDTLLKLKGKLSDKNITAVQVNIKPILGDDMKAE